MKAFPLHSDGILFECEEVHISLICKGDTVYHNGESKTVGKDSLKHDPFFGYTLFGDHYLLGYKPVIRFKTTSGSKLIAVE